MIEFLVETHAELIAEVSEMLREENEMIFLFIPQS